MRAASQLPQTAYDSSMIVGPVISLVSRPDPILVCLMQRRQSLGCIHHRHVTRRRQSHQEVVEARMSDDQVGHLAPRELIAGNCEVVDAVSRV